MERLERSPMARLAVVAALVVVVGMVLYFMAASAVLSIYKAYVQDQAPELPALVQGEEAPLEHLRGVPAEYVGPIHDAAAAEGVPLAYFVRLLEAESSFDPAAIGGPNADGSKDYGIAQFNGRYLDYFASRYGPLDPMDPFQAIPAAARYLADLYRASGSWASAVAAYNCGLSRVLSGAVPLKSKAYAKKIIEGREE